MTRESIKAAAIDGMRQVITMINHGATPEMVALYVLDQSVEQGGVYISQAIEEVATPGTFAEAVFHTMVGYGW